jgi:phage-related holin
MNEKGEILQTIANLGVHVPQELSDKPHIQVHHAQ